MRARRRQWRDWRRQAKVLELKVLERLSSLPKGSQMQFLLTPKGSLGGVTPRQALRQGRFADVERSAQGFLER